MIIKFNKGITKQEIYANGAELAQVMGRDKDKNGKNNEYKGIILAIDNKGIEIYWDTKDGKYRPKDMDIAFTNCPINEIFKGTEDYTPIKKDLI